MNIDNFTSRTINIGDVVQIMIHEECKTRHSENMIGVVVALFSNDENASVSAYGVESNGEVIFYLSDQVFPIKKGSHGH